ncbi:MAG: NUDIX domain-containing protein [Alistipes sp.]|nr:NUDIX domain-containing protein [Alistipes sp.]MDE7129205.1 NUDIX domain-containing protein [Alistipes sp.]
MKSHTIYFTDTRVVITDRRPSAPCTVIECCGDMSVSRANIVKKVETDKFLAVITPDPDATLDNLLSQFTVVEAAGGVVRDMEGRTLMIRCRKRWDLPKGHIEEGESAVQAAVREVEEETGIAAVPEEKIGCTMHCYDTYGRWEAKRTHWWRMRPVSGCAQPQREEGITEAVWCDAATLEENLSHSYSTIIDLFSTLDRQQAEDTPPTAQCPCHTR